MADFFVVWKGHAPGVYGSWRECHQQIRGFKSPEFASFKTEDEAWEAFEEGPGVRSRMVPKITFNHPAMADMLAPFSYTIFIDGGCYPNPGPSGTGMVVFRGEELIEAWFGGYFPDGTNNTAELLGMLQALDFADELTEDSRLTKPVGVYCDSRYTIDAVTKWSYQWKRFDWRKKNGDPIRNMATIRCAHEAYDQLKSCVQIHHVKGHSGVDGNEFADQLATRAREERVMGWTPLNDLKELKPVQAGRRRRISAAVA